MRVVVDTSILIQAFINDPHTARVRTLVKSAFELHIEIHVVDFTLLECQNIIWKRVMFHGLSLPAAYQALHGLRATVLAAYQSLPFAERTLDIAVQHNLSVYDSAFIALAEALTFPLITDDQRQAAASAIGVTLKPITDFQELIL